MGQGRQEEDEKGTEMKIAERKAQSKVLFGIKKPVGFVCVDHV